MVFPLGKKRSRTGRTGGKTESETRPQQMATVLLQLIESESWDELRARLQEFFGDGKKKKTAPRGTAELIINALNDWDVANRTVLHVLCEHDPPADVVESFAKLCPMILSQQDALGRTVLHTAAACGANGEVIKALLRMAGSPVQAAKMVGALDEQGKTALALAAERSGPVAGTRRIVTLDTLRALAVARPSTLVVKDRGGMTPAERVRHVGAPEDVVRGMQRATERYMRKMAGLAVSETKFFSAFTASTSSLTQEGSQRKSGQNKSGTIPRTVRFDETQNSYQESVSGISLDGGEGDALKKLASESA